MKKVVIKKFAKAFFCMLMVVTISCTKDSSPTSETAESPKAISTGEPVTWRDISLGESYDSIKAKHPDWCKEIKEERGIKSCAGAIDDKFVNSIELRFYNNQCYYLLVMVKKDLANDYGKQVAEKFGEAEWDNSQKNLCWSNSNGVTTKKWIKGQSQIIGCLDLDQNFKGYFSYKDTEIERMLTAQSEEADRKENLDNNAKEKIEREKKLNGAM